LFSDPMINPPFLSKFFPVSLEKKTLVETSENRATYRTIFIDPKNIVPGLGRPTDRV
jgi:hypothetical protein